MCVALLLALLVLPCVCVVVVGVVAVRVGGACCVCSLVLCVRWRCSVLLVSSLLAAAAPSSSLLCGCFVRGMFWRVCCVALVVCVWRVLFDGVCR